MLPGGLLKTEMWGPFMGQQGLGECRADPGEAAGPEVSQSLRYSGQQLPTSPKAQADSQIPDSLSMDGFRTTPGREGSQDRQSERGRPGVSFQ